MTCHAQRLKPLAIALGLGVSALLISVSPRAALAQSSANAENAAQAEVVSYARQAPDLHRMLVSMGVYDVLSIMSVENLRGANEVEEQLFPGMGGAGWHSVAAELNSPDRLIYLFEQAFDETALSTEDIATTQAFIDSESGTRLIEGELAARRNFLEEGAVAAARDALVAAATAHDPRLLLLERLSDATGLIDRNVDSALSLRFALFRGLIAGGAFDNEVSDGIMLSEVYSSESELRYAAAEWLFAFQLEAYSNATDEDLEAYIAFKEHPAGRALNAALFAAFDDMLIDLSYDLGYAAADFMGGEDI